MSKSEDFYFDNFCEAVQASCEAADMLKNILSSFKEENMDADIERMHTIEHKGDNVKHKMVAEIAHAFITPIERDDIFNLSQEIDDVTDSIEDILISLYYNGVTKIKPEALIFSDLIIKCTKATKAMLEEFRNFKKSKKLKEYIIEVNHIEEEGDKLYFKYMRDLHTKEENPILIIAWREVYGFFEKSLDACEDVADIVESIVIDNI